MVGLHGDFEPVQRVRAVDVDSYSELRACGGGVGSGECLNRGGAPSVCVERWVGQTDCSGKCEGVNPG